MVLDDLFRSQRKRGAGQFDVNDPRLQALDPAGLLDGSSLFSQIVVAPLGRLAFISGLIGCTADNRLVTGGFDAQLEQAFANLGVALKALGTRPEMIVRLTEYIVDHEDEKLVPLRAAIERLCPHGNLPANTVVPVPRLGRTDALFEVEAVVALPVPQ